MNPNPFSALNHLTVPYCKRQPPLTYPVIVPDGPSIPFIGFCVHKNLAIVAYLSSKRDTPACLSSRFFVAVYFRRPFGQRCRHAVLIQMASDPMSVAYVVIRGLLEAR